MSNDGIENVGVIILAAGLGTRMKSDKAKVLHPILGRPMIDYVLSAACEVTDQDVVVVVGHQADLVREACLRVRSVNFALQQKQLGTGHAVLCAMPEVRDSVQHVIILCGDVPLLRPKTIQALLNDHILANRDLSLLAVALENPTGYGRVIMNADRKLSRIVEEADATDEQKKIKLINTGIYCVSRTFLSTSLNEIRPDNAQGEFYLTDIIEVGYRMRKHIGVLVGSDAGEVSGVNTVADLKAVESLMAGRGEKP